MRTQEKFYAALGLLLIPPVVGSFALLVEDTPLSVRSCEEVQGRRGVSLRIVSDSGERLQLWPAWLGGPERDAAVRSLCEDRSARVRIRGARIESLPFWQRVISDVEPGAP